MSILALILKWLGGGVLQSVLGHLEKRKELELGDKKLKTEVTIAEIKAEIERRNAQKEVLIKEAESPIQWLPRFTFGMTAAIYFLAVVLDSIFDFPGVVLKLPETEAEIMMIIVGGLFLHAGATQISRAIRK